MEEKEIIEISIEDLNNAYDKIVQAMKDIIELDELDEEYSQLEQILDKIKEVRMNKESKLEKLQEIEEDPDTKYQQFLAEMSDKIYEDSLNED